MMIVNSKLRDYFKEYSSFHQTKGNQVCHYIGVPLIAVTLLGLLSYVDLGWIRPDALLRADAGLLLLVIICGWYFSLDWKIASFMLFFTLGMYFMGRALPIPILIGGFVLGWGFQLLGHWRYEKNNPALLKTIEHIFIAPLWLFAKTVGYYSPK